ncbi:MAG: hypothetical protein QTN59_15190 [Candidatus Electrothrix communis]|nr:MAG: hypothetical protein QTN59_15190 [Candidatus Electrothrix communis]
MMDSINNFQKTFFKKHDYYKVITLLLQKGETVEIPLTGHCMKPVLCEKNLITIKPIEAEQLHCGNVAIYHINGRLKAHRFLKFITINGKKHILTKSDRRYDCDCPVPVSDFLGIITRVKKDNLIINYETKKWKIINMFLGKFSSCISFVERPAVFFLRLPRRCAGKLLRAVTKSADVRRMH